MKQQQMLPTEVFGIAPVEPRLEVGIEIECEGRNLIHEGVLSYWKMTRDPSLRGEESVEYVLKKPVPRDKVGLVVEYLEKKLRVHGAVLRPSNRTSLHVHVNVQDMTMREIVQYVVVYRIVENLLVDHCGDARKGNLFCLRSSEAEYLVRRLETCIRTDQYQNLQTDDLRYASCNLKALGKYGSLEFRSHASTVDAGDIDRWVQMLLEVKDYSRTFPDPTKIIRAFSELGPRDFLRSIGLTIFKTLDRVADRDYQMSEGMNVAQAVAYAGKWLPPAAPRAFPKIKAKAEEPVPVPFEDEDQPWQLPPVHDVGGFDEIVIHNNRNNAWNELLEQAQKLRPIPAPRGPVEPRPVRQHMADIWYDHENKVWRRG